MPSFFKRHSHRSNHSDSPSPRKEGSSPQLNSSLDTSVEGGSTVTRRLADPQPSASTTSIPKHQSVPTTRPTSEEGKSPGSLRSSTASPSRFVSKEHSPSVPPVRPSMNEGRQPTPSPRGPLPEDEGSRLHKAICEKEDELATLRQELRAVNETATAKNEEIVRLHKEVETVRRESAVSVDKEKLEQRIASLEAELSISRGCESELQTRNADLERMLEHLRRDSQEDLVSFLESQRDELFEQLALLQAAVSSQDGQMKEMNIERDALISEITEARKALKAVPVDSESLHARHGDREGGDTSSLSEECDTLHKQLASLEESLSEERATVKNLRFGELASNLRIEQLQLEKERLEEQLEKSRTGASTNDAQETVELRKRVERQERWIKELEEKTRVLNSQISEQERELTAAYEERESTLADFESSQRSYHDLEKTLQELRSELLDEKNAASDTQNIVLALEKKLADQRRESEEKLASIEGDNWSLERRVQELTALAAADARKIEILGAQCEEAHKELEHVKCARNTAAANGEGVAAEIKRENEILQARLAGLTSERDDALKRIEVLRVAQSSSEERVATLALNVENLQRKAAEIESQRVAEHEKLIAAEAAIEKLNKIQKVSEEERIVSANHVAALEKELASVQDANASLHEKADKQQGIIARQKDLLRDAADRMEALEKGITNSQETIAQLEEQLESHRSLVSDANERQEKAVSAQRSEAQQLTEKFHSAEAAWVEERASFERQKQDLLAEANLRQEQAVAAQRLELQRLTEELRAMKEVLSDERTSFLFVQRSFEEASADVRRLKEEIATEHSENQSLLHRLAENKRRMDSLETERDQLVERLKIVANANQQGTHGSEEAEALRNTVIVLEQKLAVAENEIEVLQTKRDTQTADRDAEARRAAQLEGAIAERDAARTELARLRLSLDEVRSQLHKSEASAAAACSVPVRNSGVDGETTDYVGSLVVQQSEISHRLFVARLQARIDEHREMVSLLRRRLADALVQQEELKMNALREERHSHKVEMAQIHLLFDSLYREVVASGESGSGAAESLKLMSENSAESLPAFSAVVDMVYSKLSTYREQAAASSRLARSAGAALDAVAENVQSALKVMFYISNEMREAVSKFEALAVKYRAEAFRDAEQAPSAVRARDMDSDKQNASAGSAVIEGMSFEDMSNALDALLENPTAASSVGRPSTRAPGQVTRAADAVALAESAQSLLCRFVLHVDRSNKTLRGCVQKMRSTLATFDAEDRYVATAGVSDTQSVFRDAAPVVRDLQHQLHKAINAGKMTAASYQYLLQLSELNYSKLLLRITEVISNLGLPQEANFLRTLQDSQKDQDFFGTEMKRALQLSAEDTESERALVTNPGVQLSIERRSELFQELKRYHMMLENALHGYHTEPLRRDQQDCLDLVQKFSQSYKDSMGDAYAFVFESAEETTRRARKGM